MLSYCTKKSSTETTKFISTNCPFSSNPPNIIPANTSGYTVSLFVLLYLQSTTVAPEGPLLGLVWSRNFRHTRGVLATVGLSSNIWKTVIIFSSYCEPYNTSSHPRERLFHSSVQRIIAVLTCVICVGHIMFMAFHPPLPYTFPAKLFVRAGVKWNIDMHLLFKRGHTYSIFKRGRTYLLRYIPYTFPEKMHQSNG